ncbi:MAG: hypothetical protein ABL994_19300, partial [Verrucomicrobiales bacterium]
PAKDVRATSVLAPFQGANPIFPVFRWFHHRLPSRGPSGTKGEGESGEVTQGDNSHTNLVVGKSQHGGPPPGKR